MATLDNDNRAAIDLAFECLQDSEAHTNIFEELIKHGASVNCDHGMLFTALQRLRNDCHSPGIVTTRYYMCVKILLMDGVDHFKQWNSSSTPQATSSTDYIEKNFKHDVHPAMSNIIDIFPRIKVQKNEFDWEFIGNTCNRNQLDKMAKLIDHAEFPWNRNYAICNTYGRRVGLLGRKKYY